MDTTSNKRIVVGFDSSPEAALAVRWAADEARRRELGLRVVIARGDLYTVSSWADEWTQGLAEEWGSRARKLLAELGADDTEVVVRDGLPSGVLTKESEEAEAVVIGSRGHGAVTGLFQGSVSQQVTRHAACPVIVVRRAEDASSTKVVVGVDGSSASLDALRFALDFAARRGYAVTVIFCPDRWQAYGDERPAELVPELIAELEAREQLVQDEIAQAGREAGVAVDVQLVASRPAHALSEASHSAAVVVVGSRGRGAFAGMVLGSVSADVLRTAHCPVIVVR